MLEEIAPQIWYTTHAFTVNGVPTTTRMTVVRLHGKHLWLHSPVPIDTTLRRELMALGEVRYIVAPSKVHHLFAGECADLFPQARLFGAPGLREKRKDLTRMEDLPAAHGMDWWPDLDYVLFEGIPLANETDWFHTPSGTLILTDVCQWWRGDLPWQADWYARLTGVRHQLNLPHTVRLLTRNKLAARASAQRILQWPIKRVIVAHNAIIEHDAHAALTKAFAALG
jgi:hypothetical protein